MGDGVLYPNITNIINAFGERDRIYDEFE